MELHSAFLRSNCCKMAADIYSFIRNDITTARHRLKHLVTSTFFNNFILIAILINSSLIASTDYGFVDENYQPRTDCSLRNYVIEKAEIIFTIIFFVECILKSIAYGFARGKEAYLKDGWNVLDFIILVAGILSFIPGVPNFSIVRGFRVLRPLRSVSRLPNVRKIVNVFFGSLSELANAMVLLLFILVCFSLFGMSSWSGSFEARCRITPFPLRMPSSCRSVADACWNDFIVDAVTNPDAHRCLPISDGESRWQILGPQDCIWPLDENDLRVCSESKRGLHSCFGAASIMGGEFNVTRTCGSNYDEFGNPRFINSFEPYNSFTRMQDATFIDSLDYGMTNFNSFTFSFVTAFQIITLEGWSAIMERVIDSWYVVPTIIAFTSLIILGGQITINILLAVITGALERIENEMKDEASLGPHKAVMITKTTPKSNENEGQSSKYSVVATTIYDLVQRKAYKNAILCAIIFNTIVLSSDHYGISPGFQAFLDTANFVNTVIFIVDMVLHCTAFGLKKYWSSPSTSFDGIVALVSMAEIVAVRVYQSGTSKTSSISAFRSLRILRLFKMVKQWTSINRLLATIARAASEIRSFAILLVLVIVIYALVGMQLFANRLHFDESGAHVSITDSDYDKSTIPRSNFDDSLSAVTTVFQVLTGENWNEVMITCWRATSWVAPVYFISLIVQGVFCCLSLFLAILIRQFNGSDLVSSHRISPEKEGTNEIEETPHSCGKTAKSFCWGHFNCSKYVSIQKHITGLVQSRVFDNALTVAIVISSIILALDNPLRNPTSPMTHVLQAINKVFVLVFIVEFLMKVLTSGLCKYFEDTWNILDFAAVVASVADMLNVTGGSALRLMRLLRVLRPLRMINHSPELKLVVEALLLSLPSVINVAAVSAVFILVFAVFGLTFLKGTFYECASSDLTAEQINLITYPPESKDDVSKLSWIAPECRIDSFWDENVLPSSKTLCQCMNANWVQTIPQNFDNIWSAFALLFEISTTEGWVDVMNAAIDQRGINMQPVQGSNKAWAIFFISFIFVGSFFLLELFVGAIVENFSRLRESRGYGIMSVAQRKWAATQSFVTKLRPERLIRRPKQRLRARCYDFVMSPWFDGYIVSVIAANSISIATLSFGDHGIKARIIETLNGVFSTIFAAEMVLKILAFGSLYFRLGWNRFDFTIVISDIAIGFFVRLFVDNQNLLASVPTLVSLMRIGRLVRLVRHIKQLRTPFNTLVAVIPSVFNIGALLLLLLFIYASVGVELYAMIGFHGNGLSKQSNFRTIGNAMLLLMRFSTGENWNGFMRSMMDEREDCDPNPIYNEFSPWCLDEKDYPGCTEINGCQAGYSVFIYFYSFTLIVSCVVLNLIVGVVLEAFENSSEGDILELSDLENFVKTWALFDPEASWYIKANDVQSFFARLSPPLGLGSASKVLTDECLLGIGVNENKEVHILNVASLLAKRIAKEKQGSSFGELSNSHPVQAKLNRLSSLEDVTTTLDEFYFNHATVILRAVRRFRQKNKHPSSPAAMA